MGGGQFFNFISEKTKQANEVIETTKMDKKQEDMCYFFHLITANSWAPLKKQNIMKTKVLSNSSSGHFWTKVSVAAKADGFGLSVCLN